MKCSGEKEAIPDGWQRVSLGDVAEVVMGQSPPGESVVEWDGGALDVGGLPFIQGNAEFGTKYPAPVKWCLQPYKTGVLGDILISVRAPVGETNKVATQLGIGRGLAAVRFGKESQPFGWHVLNHSKGTLGRVTQGSTFEAIGSGELRNLPILLPPLLEQRAIAAVLDSIDDAIEGSEAVIAATERLRDALLHDLLTRGLPGQHTEWRDVPGLGTIPADWEVVRLGDVAEVVMGQSPPGMHCNRDGEGVPLLNGPTEYGPNHPVPAQWTTDAKKMSRERDVLFCVRGATAGRMNWADRDYAIGRGVAAIRHRSGPPLQRFLRAMVDFRLAELLSHVTGSTFPNLSYDQITQLRVPAIPLADQRAIAAALGGVDAAIEVARDEAAGLRFLKESTAEVLLSGRVVGSQENSA